MVSREEVFEAVSSPIPSIRTPFTRDGGIDFSSLRNMVEFDIDAGCKTLLITWGDSLFSLLGDSEIAEVARVVVEQARGRALVIACTGSWGTPQAVEFAKFARGAGVDLLMLMCPNWASSCTADTIVAHYAAVAEHIPLVANSGIFMPFGMSEGLNIVERLAREVDNIFAAKGDWVGEFDRKMLIRVRDRWAVFSGGQKQNHLDAYPYGCHGYLSTFASFRPETTTTYWNALKTGDLERAVRVISNVDMPYVDYIMRVRGGFDAAMHGVLEVYGISERWRRPPYYSLNDEEMEQLSAFMSKLPVG